MTIAADDHGGDAEAVRDLHIHQVLIEDVYTSNKKLNIGDLMGNRFHVKVRDTLLQGRGARLGGHGDQGALWTSWEASPTSSGCSASARCGR